MARKIAETVQQQDGFARAVQVRKAVELKLNLPISVHAIHCKTLAAQVNNSVLSGFYKQEQGTDQRVLEVCSCGSAVAGSEPALQ